MRMMRTVALLAASLALLCAPAAAQRVNTLPSAATLTGAERITATQGTGCATNVAPCAAVTIQPTQIGAFLAGTFQPKDADLDAIAALATQPFGRSLLVQADARAVRTAIGAGSPGHPGYVANRWYWSTRSPAQSGQGATVNQIRFAAMVLGQSITITDVATRIGLSPATGNIQIAVYAADPTTKMPTGAPLATSPSLSTAALGMVSAALSTAVTAGPGVIWTAVNTDISTVGFTQSNGGNSPEQGWLIGAASVANLGTANTQASPVLYVAQTFGSWPTITAGSLSEMAGTSPVIGFRVSAAN